jgi:serine/threonine-protein kinase
MGQDVDARTDIFAVGIILWELLAGQRLFLGETDFQTVKKVQASVVPAISQINKKVPIELERVIARALARDPTQRFPTARALGQELSKFMFRYAVPVTTFDIENLVHGAMRERQRYRPQQASIIDKLIEEALFEFTSLTDDPAAKGGVAPPAAVEASAARTAGAVAGGGYLDMGRWIEEISVSQKGGLSPPVQSTTVPLSVREGNLAALEDEPSAPMFPPAGSGAVPRPTAAGVPAARGFGYDPSGSSARPMASSSGRPIVGLPPSGAPPSSAGTFAAPPSSSPVPLARPSGAPLLPAADPSDPLLMRRRANAATRLGVAVAVAVAAVAGAAAWFAHLIPHP